MRAAAEGPFFPEWEFRALFGLEREEVAAVAESWPIVLDGRTGDLAVNNALNSLIGYPHGREDDAWPTYISAPPSEVRAVFARWREIRDDRPSDDAGAENA